MAGQSFLQGYLQGEALRQKQEQIEFQNQQAKDTLKMHQDQLEQSAKQHQEALGLQKTLAKMQMQQHFNDLYGNPESTPTQNLPQPQSPDAMGGMPQPQEQQPYAMTPQQGFSGDIAKMFPEGIQIDPNFQGRQVKQTQAMAEAKAAPRTAQLENQLQNKSDISNATIASLEKRNEETLKSKEGIATQTNLERQFAANRAADAKMFAATLSAQNKSNSQIDPDELDALTRDTELGVKKDTDVPIKLRGPVSLLRQKRGTTAFDPKTAENLKGVSDLNGVFSQMKQVGDMLSDSQIGTMANVLKQQVPGTDLHAKVAEVRARVGQILRNLGGLKGQRFNIVEVNNALDAMASGKLKKSQVIQNIKDWQRDAYHDLLSDTLGGVPDKQKLEILNKYDVKVYDTATQRQVPLVRDLKDGGIGVYNPEKGAYVHVMDGNSLGGAFDAK